MYKEMEPSPEMTHSAPRGWLAYSQSQQGAPGGLSSASLPLCPSPSSPCSSFVFSSLSFPGVGLVSAPDPVQYLSPGSAICSHFHMFNIHINCLLLCPIAVTGSCSLRLGAKTTMHPSFSCFTLSSPGEYRGLQPRAE